MDVAAPRSPYKELAELLSAAIATEESQAQPAHPCHAQPASSQPASQSCCMARAMQWLFNGFKKGLP